MPEPTRAAKRPCDGGIGLGLCAGKLVVGIRLFTCLQQTLYESRLFFEGVQRMLEVGHFGLERLQPATDLEPEPAKVGRHAVESVAQSTDVLEISPGLAVLLLDAGDLGSGVYLLHMEAGSFRSTKKMLLLR